MDSNLQQAFLSRLYPPEKLESLIPAYGEWHPYPKAGERTAWEGFPAAFRKAHIEKGVQMMAKPMPHLPADLYLQFARNGNRNNYEKPYFERREILAMMTLAECMEGKGRFLDAITNAIWLICEESSWCLPAHINAQKAGSGLPDVTEPVVDLFAAETSAELAWVYYLLGEQLDTVSPLVCPRIEYEIQTRILSPNLKRNDFWWMGFNGRRVNNWNPWVNSNWLASVLLVEKDPGRRVTAISKVLRSLDKFIVPYPKDGGCDEGPGYWQRAGASLYDNLELLYLASNGKINVYNDPLVQEIGKFVYRAHIDGGYYVNFADAPARLVSDPALVYGYGKRIGDPLMMSFGAWVAKEIDLVNTGYAEGARIASSLGRALPTLFHLNELAAYDPKTPPQVRDVWLNEIEVAVMRDQGGTGKGLYIAAKGGHNDESHNHNDIGHFVVYKDGKPVIVDAGVETYTRKTFSPQRYEIWTMQSAYHSLPTINGIQQAPGREFAARAARHSASDEAAEFSLDIAGAYPAEAGVKTWLRTIRLERGKAAWITDEYSLDAPAKSLTLSLVTACKVEFGQAGVIHLLENPLAEGRVSGSGVIEYDPAVLSAACERVALTDERLQPVWGDHLTRIVFTALNPGSAGQWSLKIA
ncbi:MAG TPA: heparinase II/III family protein [Anaerolineaceae bacterium]